MDRKYHFYNIAYVITGMLFIFLVATKPEWLTFILIYAFSWMFVAIPTSNYKVRKCKEADKGGKG